MLHVQILKAHTHVNVKLMKIISIIMILIRKKIPTSVQVNIIVILHVIVNLKPPTW